ncbi:peptide chain release factor N(5)-glutamine methyltransferase [Lutispora thermophila]|uniref:Release factor glutamine methyltransferase n=1 Tax=Lutispora thermophila DSM 19022 TaxID=1122184 RepID=A0A1M6AN95_9FIRM|nr:peptide chain release factor N(5)-glutamine methyltransferase [Lutispora thermophila]SHI37663.1 release factor glutamine methyltransferase [Lutispora thermophila DSM 19022]
MVGYTVGNILKEGAAKLKGSGSPSPYLDAQVLLCHIASLSKVDIIVDRDKILEEDTSENFFRLIEERKAGKPIQYITGHQEFMGLDFYVNENVLIPRPDTEILVEKVLELLKNRDKPVIGDICTGTGAIAVSLAYYISDAFVYASDISDDALECCKRNIDRHGLGKRMKLLQGDLLGPLYEEGLEGKLDALVSNPPYISKNDMETLPISVRGFEPHLALYGGEEGLDFYIRILKDAARFLKKGGLLAFEIGYDQGCAVRKLIEDSGRFKDIMIVKDLAGLDRVVYCNMEE